MGDNFSRSRKGRSVTKATMGSSRPKASRRVSVAAAIVGMLALGQQTGVDAEPCVLSTGETTVTIGDPTPVCLVVNGLGWVVDSVEKYSQVLIIPDADDFSRFSVSGSWNSSDVAQDPILTTFGETVGVHVESVGKYSFQKLFRRQEEGKTFPIHTAIIAVDEGEVTGITWDDGCHFCGSSDCENNTYDYTGGLVEDTGKECYWPDSDCMMDGVDDKVSTLCQLRVYVVWTGTDSKGNYFTSFSKRLSMFAGESVESLIDDAASTYQDTIEPADE